MSFLPRDIFRYNRRGYSWRQVEDGLSLSAPNDPRQVNTGIMQVFRKGGKGEVVENWLMNGERFSNPNRRYG
jgi:hypothetical protein